MRTLLPETKAALDLWARDNAKMFAADPTGQVRRDPKAPGGKRIILDREWIVQQMYNFTFKDEHEYVVAAFRGLLADDPASLEAFETMAAAKFQPRSDEVFRQLLEEKRPAGYKGAPYQGDGHVVIIVPDPSARGTLERFDEKEA